MSFKKSLVAILLGVILVPVSVNSGAEQVQTSYSEVSDRANELIKYGITLHDQGKYYEAIKAYEEALLEDPGNIFAIYEITFSYVTAKDYQKAHQSARRGLANRTPLVAGLYMLSATALDQMGKPDEAVIEFVEALKHFPNHHGLNLNLAVTYAGLGDFDNARAAAEKTILLTPNHPSAHLILGQILIQQNQNVPALMALGRFLTLEPNSRRSPVATDIVKSILAADFTTGANGQPVVVLDVGDLTDKSKAKSSYQSIASQLKIVAVGARVTQQKKNDTSVAGSPAYYGMTILSSLLSGHENHPDGFSKRFYVPFYEAIEANDYNHAFARLVLMSLNPAEAKSWMQANQEPVVGFAEFSRNYTGPESTTE